MPIRYRRFYLQKLIETNEKQQEEMDKKYGNAKKTETLGPSKKPQEPLPIPDFATKVRAPKK